MEKYLLIDDEIFYLHTVVIKEGGGHMVKSV